MNTISKYLTEPNMVQQNENCFFKQKWEICFYGFMRQRHLQFMQLKLVAWL